jgi:uncharacterized damage-inducible protein DinB
MKPEIFIEMALHAWNIQIRNADKFFDSVTDEQLQNRVAPGKNRIMYLLGHLVAVNDGMIKLFSLGDRKYADLDEGYVINPDKEELNTPGAAELRAAWKKQNEELSRLFSQMTAEDWFSRHTSMTDEDLKKQPSRNKLSVLLNRTNHTAYHLGQLMLAKDKDPG